MPRKPRVWVDGLYHVAGHGSDDRLLFLDDRDRSDFLAHLSLTLTTLGISVVSFTLMTNHYHAVLAAPGERMAVALQRVHGGYAYRHNRRHGRRAHLFRAHCLARLVAGDDDLVALAAYLALNPVVAGIVLEALDWPWSSVRAHCGEGESPIPLDESHLRAAFDDQRSWRTAFRRLVVQ